MYVVWKINYMYVVEGFLHVDLCSGSLYTCMQ